LIDAGVNLSVKQFKRKVQFLTHQKIEGSNLNRFHGFSEQERKTHKLREHFHELSNALAKAKEDDDDLPEPPSSLKERHFDAQSARARTPRRSSSRASDTSE
jgi:hypothetical protein